MKKMLLIGLAIIGLVIVAVLVVPPFINLGAYKTRYLPLVEEALQRKVDVGEVRLRLVPTPAIRISSLRVADDPAFSKDPFFAAEQLRLQLKFWPLLKGELRVDEFVLEKPVVGLRKLSDGTFNFADIARKKGAVKKREVTPSAPKSHGTARISDWIPARLRIEGGEISLQTKGKKPLTVRGIDVSLEDFSADRPFPYRISLDPPGFKTVTLAGRLNYEESEATLKFIESHLKAQDVDFAVNGAVSGLSAVPKVNLTVANDGFETKPIFQLLSAAGLVPRELQVAGPMGLRLALTGPSHSLAAAVAAHLKELKVNDSRAFDGTVTGDIALSLPLGGEAPITHSLAGNGKLAAKDGKLTNVDLISKIQLLTGLIGLPKEQSSGATTFKTLETEFKVGGGIAEIQRLFLSSPLMEAIGSGKMDLASVTLDLGLEAALAPEISARAGSGKAATFFKDSQGRIVVPLKMTGPVRKPSVSLDSSKLVKKGVGQLFERFFRGR